MVARHLVVGERDRRRGRRVVLPVHPGRGDVQLAGRDVGGGAPGRVGQVVVAGIATTDRNPAHRDRLAGGHILVREGGRCVGRRDGVARHLVRRQRDRRRGGRVVAPVLALGGYGQGAR